MNYIGYGYYNKKQYDKALAWFILVAMENNPNAHNDIGSLYFDGLGVPKNYLCALKWLLKSADGNYGGSTPNNIGKLFENGQGVSLDKNKALEWYCHGGYNVNIGRLNRQGYH
jgi:TPR repeat protein